MIQEIIVSTQNKAGIAHIAPMGVHSYGDEWIILPFRPSTTLDNLLETQCAVFNYCDDVRVFAGCLTGRRNWQLKAAEKVNAPLLTCALAYSEVEVVRVIDDAIRPQLYCRVINTVNIAPFKGFNRAQYAVLEAAILISRLNRLPLEKVNAELDYLRIGFEKTAGEKEREAWDWLMAVIENYQQGLSND
ncbi:MAG: DUF447 domain-containing protein [Methylococcaceae bacterium]